MRYLLVIVIFAIATGLSSADDIVSMPSANQLKAGEVDVAGYYFWLDNPSMFPQYVQLQTVYVGLTDRIEIDAHRSAVDKDETAVVFVASYKLLSETLTKPDLVIGCKNLFETETSGDVPVTPSINEREKSRERSFFLSAAKTFFMRPGFPGPPLVRAHLSLGTADWTMMAEERHKGLFGGLQFLFRPDVGGVIQHDGQDLITALTYMPPKTGLTFKGGTFGDHKWFGVAWRTNLK